MMMSPGKEKRDRGGGWGRGVVYYYGWAEERIHHLDLLNVVLKNREGSRVFIR